jgi:hypothetical protein
MALKFKITGMDELKKEMNQLIKEMREATGEGVQESAERLAGVVRRNAPEGPTGNLGKAVTTKGLPDKWGYPPTTLVGLDYGIAPHQHLVEFGTAPRHHKSGKSVGAMPASGFFRASIDEAGYIVDIMRKHAKKPIKKRGG